MTAHFSLRREGEEGYLLAALEGCDGFVIEDIYEVFDTMMVVTTPQRFCDASNSLMSHVGVQSSKSSDNI